jgi:hypothetical protein
MSAQIENQKITRVLNAVAAGTTNQNTASVDMTGWDTVEFVALMGALTATQVTKLKTQQSSDDASTDAYDDLAGSATAAMADADTNKTLRSEIVKPTKRYVRAVLVRGTANAVIDGIIAIQRRARRAPITQSSTVSAVKTVVQPAEGTA